MLASCCCVRQSNIDTTTSPLAAACRSHRKRVFETVKNVNQTVRRRSVTPTSSNIPGSNQSLSSRTSPQSSGLSSPHSGVYGGDVSGDGVALDNRVQSILMETASNQDRFGVEFRRIKKKNNNKTLPMFSLCSGSGVDGREKKANGAEDLRLALRRLSLRRQNNLSERRFFEEERDWRRAGHGPVPDSLDHESVMTPSESIMSLGNIHVWASRGPYLPDKLQIVKPLEGEGDRKAGSGRKVGRRWARDRAGSRKNKGARDRKDTPLSLMLFNSFWSLMHHHKSGSFTSPHGYHRDPRPRGWL